MICPDCKTKFSGGRIFFTSGARGAFRECPNGHWFEEPQKKASVKLESISVGEYKIFRLPNGNYLISSAGGEAMETRKELFEDFIHTFYVQEF